ncbi:MAG: universal stress protein [Gemmatimonadota bacterium]|jgi:nucleotide-binding universal stress UspA family protein
MMPIRRVLVPLDGSLTAESILPHTRSLATSLGSSVRLLHVLEHGRAGGLSRDSVEWRLHRAEARSYLDQVAERLDLGGLEVDTLVAEGRPGRQVIFEARRWKADLIALSSHGHGGPDLFSLGGIAQKIVSRAGVSILLSRADPPPPEGAPEVASYKRVILPVDLSRRSDWALSIGVRIARSGGGEIELLHVVCVPELPERTPGDFVGRVHRTRLIEIHNEAAREYLAAMEQKFAAPGLTIHWRLLESSTVPGALAEMTRADVDGLLVVSAHGLSGASPWPYGSVASHLIMHGKLPLLVLQDVPREMPLGLESESTWSSSESPASWNG